MKAALAAGVIFNLANLLLVAGIEMAGLAVAFPVAIGIALVVAVSSASSSSREATYCWRRRGSAPWSP